MSEANQAEPKLLGKHPLAKDTQGKLLQRIGTLFPYSRTVVTLPGVHATQRLDYLDWVDKERSRHGTSPLTEQERSDEWATAVDLIMEDDKVLIRPDPEQMALAFKADEVLSQWLGRRKVGFLHARHEKVLEAIKRRGEYWRVTPIPTTAEGMVAMIRKSRIGIGSREVYYYNRTSGTRFLTAHEFFRLGELPDPELRQMLQEIQQNSAAINRLGNPEVAFFQADRSFSKLDFAPHDFLQLEAVQLRGVYTALVDKFFRAVPDGMRHDGVDDVEWRKRMFAKLIAHRDEVVTEEVLAGLASEYYMQLEWVPGGRFEQGELILDPLFTPRDANGRPLDPLCNDMVVGFIFNFIREFGDIEYLNVARVVASLGRGLDDELARRDVFLAEIKTRSHPKPIVRVIRMQKYGVIERLKAHMSLQQAMYDSDEYTEYVLDRRLGCRQLGMNILSRLTSGKIEERYFTFQYPKLYIWSPYFERDYIRGCASDKIPQHRYRNAAFALKLAELLGAAAAPNMIVGRCTRKGWVVFDDGDEVLIEDDSGQPKELLVVDQMGTFQDYEKPLRAFAAAYARPVHKRIGLVPNLDDFAAAYLQAFRQRFVEIQREYRERQGIFDNLFALRRFDEQGSFAFRWVKVLTRLQETNADELTELIRQAVVAGPPPR